jgi:hypothetical protein
LQLVDAVQMLTDTFREQFVGPSSAGHRCIRCDVRDALRALAPTTEWATQIDCWES